MRPPPHGRRATVATFAAGLALAGLVLVPAACSKDQGSAAELCDMLGDGRSFTALFDQGFDPTDTDRAQTQLEAAAVDLQQLHDAAPKDMRDHLRDEQRYLDAVAEILDQVDPDDPAAVVAAINDLDEQRQAAEVASVELQAFEREHCR